MKVTNEFAKHISDKRTRTQKVEKKITKILQNSDWEWSSCPTDSVSVVRGTDETKTEAGRRHVSSML